MGHKKVYLISEITADMIHPCPFCSGEAEVVGLDSNNEYLNRAKARNYYDYTQRKKLIGFYPTCKGEIMGNCPGIVVEDSEFGGTPCDCQTVNEAIELWNTRALPPERIKL